MRMSITTGEVNGIIDNNFATLPFGSLIMTWISARIYRVGILMYGKKATWKELGKWIFYKV